MDMDKNILTDIDEISKSLLNWKISFSNLSCTCDSVDLVSNSLAQFHILHCRGNLTRFTILTNPWGATNQYHDIKINIYSEFDNIIDRKIVKQRLYSNLQYAIFPYYGDDDETYQIQDFTSHVGISDKWIIIPSQVSKCNNTRKFWKMEYHDRQTGQVYIIYDNYFHHDCSTLDMFKMIGIGIGIMSGDYKSRFSTLTGLGF